MPVRVRAPGNSSSCLRPSTQGEISGTPYSEWTKILRSAWRDRSGSQPEGLADARHVLLSSLLIERVRVPGLQQTQRER